MKRTILPVFLLTGLVLAQPPGPGARARWGAARFPSDALKSELQLTDQQVNQLRDLRRKQMENLRPAGQQVTEEVKRFRDLMESANPDPAAVGKQVLALRALREQAKARRAAAGEEARAILTPQQREKLKELEGSRDLMPALRQARILGLLDAPEPGRESPVRGALRLNRRRF